MKEELSDLPFLITSRGEVIAAVAAYTRGNIERVHNTGPAGSVHKKAIESVRKKYKRLHPGEMCPGCRMRNDECECKRG